MDTQDEYTMTRIRRDYLAKLKVLADTNKRSAAKELEVLIDKQWRQIERLRRREQ